MTTSKKTDIVITQMRTIFFDFETSSRDPLGQILSYSFICVDDTYNIIEELNGLIRPNRTQFPDIDAILTNKLNIHYLIQHGEADYIAAKRIYDFLETYCAKYAPITLVGYNSNAFDLTFLRNLLISYGYNPYFKGKLQNKDVLHYVQFLAFQNPSIFPWVRTTRQSSHYYSFKLEDMAMCFRLLSGLQSHNAREDVVLTINLVRILEMHFKYKFKDFTPTEMLSKTRLKNGMVIGKQKKRHFADSEEGLKKFHYIDFLILCKIQKSFLMLNLSAYKKHFIQENNINQPISIEEKLACLSYINPNKAFFILEPCDELDQNFENKLADTMKNDPFFDAIIQTPSLYFSYTKKNWDIMYQIHEMGFERIEQLHIHINTLIKKPESYDATLSKLLNSLAESKSETEKTKNRYMLTLYNRAYLNHHPEPNPKYLKKYLIPRYITGTLLRDKSEFSEFNQTLDRLNKLIASKEDTLDVSNLKALKQHIDANWID